MRILYIVPYAPSLIRVRPYQLIRSLARRGHHVELAALWSSGEEEEGLLQMALQDANVTLRARRLPFWRPAWNCLRALPSQTPLQAAFCFEPSLLHEVDRALSEHSFDVIHVEHLRGSLFGLHVHSLLTQNRGKKGIHDVQIPIVWDCVDCISHLFSQASKNSRSFRGRWMTRLELPRTRPFEGWLTTQFDHTLVTSAIDRDALRELAGFQANEDSKHGKAIQDSEISIVPNGVDLGYFRPSEGVRDPATLVFSGKMSYHANVTAASYLIQDIMPRIWKHRPDVKLLIAGKNPPRSLVELAASARKHEPASRPPAVASTPAVTVTGSVPDMRPYLNRATISVAPLLYGAGIQNKVLEAMACATPVVASPRAVSALSAQGGRDIVVADDPEAFAHETLALLADSPRRNAIGLAGRTYAEAHHSWDQIGSLLESAYQRVILKKMIRAGISFPRASSASRR